MAVSNDFSSSALDLNGKVTLSQPSALVWGPDGRLYVTENGGNVNVLTVKFGDPNPDDEDNTVSFYVDAAEKLSLDIQNHNDSGSENTSSSRQVTGIDVGAQYDAAGNQLFVDENGELTTEAGGNTPAVTMYVTSSDKRVGAGGSGNDANLDTNSGVVTMLEQTGANNWNQVDLVRGLSRSEENHATNGLEVVQDLDATGKLVSERLIVAAGGDANTGAPSNNFAGQQETPLSGAILEVDVTGLKGLGVQTDDDNRKYIYDLPTLDDPTREGETDLNDPNGGHDGLNSAKLDYGSYVTIYSPGYRNPYDVEVTEDGRVWTYDNGANNSWGGRPIGEAGDNGGTTDYAQDEDYIATNLNSGDGNSSDDINLESWNPSNNDNFHEVTRSDDLDGGALSVGGNGPVTTYTGPEGLTYVYGGHPNPTRAEGAKAGLLFSPEGGTDNAYLLVSTNDTYNEGTDDYDQVIAWLDEVENNYGSVGDGDLTKKVLEVSPGVEYDIYALPDGSGAAVPVGGSAPENGTLLGQAGLPADIASIVDWRNPVEGDYKEAGKTDGALDSGKGSINGLAEYTSTIMDGGDTKMSGALIASVYNGGDLIIMGRNADGTMSSTGGSNAQASDRAVFQGSGQPLGLATIGDDFAERGLSQPFQGSVWSAVYGQNNQGGYTVHIEVLQPDNGKVPLAGSEIVDPDDWDLDGVDKYNDPFEFSAENGMALAAGQKIVLDFDPQGTEFNGTLAGNTGLLGAALDGPTSQAGPLADATGTDDLQEAGATANQDARTGQYLENAGDLLASGEQTDGLFDIAGNIIPGGNAPILQIKEVVPGTMVGQANTARDALQTGIRPDADVGRLMATVTAKNWIAGSTVATDQLVGMTFGDGTQANFLRLVFGEVNGQAGIEVGYEIGDANYQTLAQIAVPELTNTDFSLVDLRLEIDIDDGFAVKAYYRLGDADTLAGTGFTEIDLGSFALPEGVLRAVLDGTHTITDGDTSLTSGTSIGVVAETSDGNPLQAIDFHNIEIEAFGHEFEAASAAEANAISGTSGVDSILYTGDDAAPVTMAEAVENFDGSGSTGDYAVTANDLDNTITVGSGQTTVTTGAGTDVVAGSSAAVDGTEITDFSEDDKVVLSDATAADAQGVSYAAGSAIVTVNGAEITFSGPDFADFDPADGPSTFRFQETGEGLEISLVPNEMLIKAVATGNDSYTFHFDAEGNVVASDDPNAVQAITFDSDNATEVSGDASDAANYVTSGSSGGGGSKIYSGTLDDTQGADFGANALDQLHWVERSSNENYFGYEIPVDADGTYRVDLYLAEIYHGVSTGSFDQGDRVWDILVEGDLVEDDFDLWEAASGQPLSEVKLSYTVEVTDGAFTIDFDSRSGTGGTDQPKLSGMALYQIGGDYVPPADTTAPQIVSISVDNPQSVQDGERTATIVLSDETGFDSADFTGLDGSELTFTGIVPETVSSPEVTLSNGDKTATLTYTLTAEGNAWDTGEGQIGIAEGAYSDAAGNPTGTADGAFILEPNLDTLIKGSVALAINVGPTSNTTDDLDGADDTTYGGAITNDTILGIDLQADDPSYYSPSSKTGSNIDGKGGSTGSNPALDGSALHTYRDSANGSFTATYPIENGVYVVELHFAELYHASAGQRQGDYTINGTPWATDFDAFTEAGAADTPTSITKTITVTDGQIQIDVNADTGQPGWNALVVYEAVPADLPPTVSVGDVSVAEGEDATVTFTRIGDDADDVTVTFTIAADSASEADFGDSSPASSVVIPAGQSTATVSIPTIDDAIEEGQESFTVTIDSVSNGNGDAVIDDGIATVSIAASDSSLQIPAGGTLLDLDFETAGEPLDEGGFDRALGGAGALDDSVVTGVSGGKLIVNTSNGDLSDGDSVASKNDFVKAIDLSDAALDEIYITTQFDNPFPQALSQQGITDGIIPSYAQLGLLIATADGAGQDAGKHLKLVFGGNSGNVTQLWSHQSDVDQTLLLSAMSDTAAAPFALDDIAKVELSLRIDKSDGTAAQIVTLYNAGGAILGGVRPEATAGFVTAAPQTVPADVMTAITSGSAVVGVTSTDYNQNFDSFEASWDFLKVTSPQASDEPVVDADGPVATVSLVAPDSESDSIVATVVYDDASDIDPASIDAADLVLNGPSAASATSVGFDAASNTATYTFEAPAEGWVEGDYTATVAGAEIADLADTPNTNAGGEAGSVTLAFEDEPVTAYEPGAVVFRVNAGGPLVTAIDASGVDWEADTEATPNQYATSIDANDVYTDTGTDSAEEIKVIGENAASNVDGTVVPEDIFFHERSDNTVNATALEYTFPVEGGKSYYVTVYYTENWADIASGGPRQFDVAVNGAVPAEFADINPYAESGETIGVAHKRTFLVTQSADESGLTLSFLHEDPAIQNPKVNGIEIVEAVPVSTDTLVSIAGPGALVEDGDTGDQMVPFTLTVEDDTFAGDIEVELSVNGAAATPQTLTFANGEAIFEAAVPRDARWNDSDSVSVELVSVLTEGYSATPSASTASATVTEDDPADSHDADGADGADPVVAGDYSDDRLAPSDIGAMQLGENVLYATQQGDGEPGGRDRDYVTFEVPEGTVLTALFLDGYASSGDDTAGFMGLQAGAAVTVDPVTGQPDGSDGLMGGIVYGDGNLANDLLPILAAGDPADAQGADFDGFTLPLGAGTYTLWLNQGGASTSVTLRAVVGTAPVAELTLAIADADPVLEADGAMLDFALTTDAPFSGEMEITYDTATETGLTQTVTFTDGAGTLSLPVANDEVDDGEDSVSVTLTGASDLSSEPTPVVLGTAAATGTVTEDDGSGYAPGDDLDGDGTLNAVDADLDGDGVDNGEETFVYDATNAGQALSRGETVTFDFDTDGTPFQNGLTGALLSPNAAAPEIDLSNAAVADGRLSVTATGGDHYNATNTQQNALVAAFSAAEGLRVETRFAAPDFDPSDVAQSNPVDYQAAGVVIGFDQDNMVKAVFGRSEPQFQLVQDNASGGVPSDVVKTPTGVTYADVAEIAITLEVFIDDSGATPVAKAKALATFYDVSGQPMPAVTDYAIAEIQLENALATAILNGDAVGAGVIQTSTGSGTQFDVSYDHLKVTALGEAPADAAPTVDAGIADQTTDEDAAFSFTVPADAFADDGGAETLTLSATLANGDPLPGWLAFDAATGTFSGTPTQAEVGELTVAVAANDGVNPPVTTAFTLNVAEVNDAPTAVTLSPVLTEIAEDADTSAGTTKVADIAIADDSVGTNELTLSGTDAALFEIVPGAAGPELHLKQDAALDFETAARLDVTVAVDDAALGAAPDATAALTLPVTDVNEAPSVALANALVEIAESTDTTQSVKVADIVVSDDALGTNELALAGEDAGLFEIVPGAAGPELHLQAGETLDAETDAALDVTVTVDDPGLGTTVDASAELSLTVTDTPNAAPTTGPIDAGTAAETATPVEIDLLQGAADSDGGTLGVANLTVQDGAGNDVAVSQAESVLTIDPAQFADALAQGDSVTVTVSYEVTDGQGGATPNTATLVIDGLDGPYTWYLDADDDGYGVDAPETNVVAYTQPAGTSDLAGDANDTDPTVHPGAPEINDGQDNDQDGATDEDNTAPATADDALLADAGEDLVVPASRLLRNDADAESDAVSVTAVSNPQNGSVSLNAATGEIIFTPAAAGPASFDYTVDDGFGGTATATVTVTVQTSTEASTATDVANAQPTDEVDEVEYTGDEDVTVPDGIENLDLSGNTSGTEGDKPQITLNSGDNTVTAGTGQHHVDLGGGSDTIVGTKETLDGDSFGDFGEDDQVVVEGGAGAQIVSRQSGSAIIGISDDGDDVADYTITFEGDVDPDKVVASDDADGNLKLTLAESDPVDEGGGEIDFSALTMSSYSGEDDTASGGATILDDGATLTLQGNTWKKFAFSDAVTLTSDSVLKLTLSSSQIGEIIGIVLETNDDPHEGGQPLFMLGGSQTRWDTANKDHLDYQNPGEVVEFEIPLADWAGQTFSHVGFINDADRAENAGANSTFSNVRLITTPPANTDPVADAETLEAAQNGTLIIPVADLLDGDTDADGDPLTLTGVANPVNGTVSFDAEAGEVTFTPTTGYLGQAAFDYTITDGNGGSATATVAVTVTDTPNEAPTADPITAGSVDEAAAPVVIDLLAAANAADADGGTLGVADVTVTDDTGAVAFGLTGSTLTIDPAQFAEALDASGDVTVTVAYTVTDGQGGETPNTATLVVDGLDGPVTWYADADGDGFGVDDPATNVSDYVQPAGTSDTAGDADDADGTIYPGAPELSDGKDNDQDGEIDEDAPSAGPGPFVFTAAALSSYDVQDEDSEAATIADGGATLTLSGNTWKKVELPEPYIVETGAVLRFEFSSTEVGEIIGIGLETDNSFQQPGQPLFQLGGSQVWNAYARQGFHTYQASDGTVTVEIPLAEWEGQSFTHLVFINDDDATGTANSTFSNLVLGVPSETNTAPVAAPDGFTTAGNTPLVVDGTELISNDSDADGDTLSVSEVSNAVNGAVSLDGGQVTFTPADGFTGQASFDYTVEDGNGGTTTATVTVTVNTDPVATSDSFETVEDAVLGLSPADLLSNDTDADGQNLTLVGVSNAVNGSVSYEDGQISFVPAAGYTGPASFDYTIEDAFGAQTTGTVSVEVTSSVPPGDGVTEITFTTGALSSYDNEDENSAGASILADGTALELSGNTWKKLALPESYEVEADTVLRFTFSSSQIGEIIGIGLEDDNQFRDSGQPLFQLGGEQINAAWFKQTFRDYDSAGETKTYEISLAEWAGQSFQSLVFINDQDDGSGANGTFSNVELVKKTVTNAEPVPADDDGLSVEGNTTLEIDPAELLANDSDPDGDALVITGVSNAVNGSATFEDGVIRFTPATDFAGDASFVYTVEDAFGATSEATVSLTVNRAPTPVADALETGAEEALYLTPAELLANDTDPDGDALTLTEVSNATGGTVVLDEEGQIVFTPDAGFSGTASFDYIVEDPRGGSATATATVTVAEADEPGGEDGTLELDFSALAITSYDVEDDGDAAVANGGDTLEMIGNAWKKVALPDSYEVGEDTVLRFELNASEIGEIVGIGLETDNNFQQPGQPLFQLGGPQNWTTYARQEFKVYDTAGETVAFEIPLGEWAGQSFSHLIFINDDDAGAGADATFSNVQLVSAPDDLPPVFEGATEVSVAEGETEVATLAATDPENGTVTYSIDGGADAARFTIDQTTGELAFVTPPDFEAPDDDGADNVYAVTVAAEDGTNAATVDLAITVTDANEAPTIAGAIDDVSTTVGSAASVDLSGLTLADEDAGDAAELRVALANGDPLPAGFTLNGSSLEVTDQAAEGSYQLAVFANDGELDSAAPVTFTVDVGTDGSVTTPTPLLRINAFGPEVAATDGGPDWSADGNGSPNSPYLSTTEDRGDTFGYGGAAAVIPEDVPEAVLDTARSSDDPFSYNIPVADLAGNGDYTVRLYLAELFSGNTTQGDRVFDVEIEGQIPAEFDNIDVAADGSAMDLEVREYDVTVTDGELNLAFLQDVSDNPIVNAIEILSAPSVPTPDTEAPTATMTLTNPAGANAPLLVAVALADASGIDAATLGAADLELAVGGFTVPATITFEGFADGTASYSIAAPAGGWVEASDIEVTLKAGEVADLAATPNLNAAVGQSLSIDLGGGETGGETGGGAGYDSDKELSGDLDGTGGVNSADSDIDGDGLANLDDRAAYDATNAGVVLADMGEISIDFTQMADGTSPFAAGFTGVAQSADGSAELDYASNDGAQVTGGRLEFQTTNPDTKNGQRAFTFLADIENDFTFEGVFDNPVYGGSELQTFSQYGLIISLTGTPGASTGSDGDFFKLVTGNPGDGFEISGRGSFPSSGDTKIPYPAGVEPTDFAQVKLTVQADVSAGTLTGFYELYDETGGTLASGTVGTVTPSGALAAVLDGSSDVVPAFGVTSTDYGGGDAFTVGVQTLKLTDGSPDPVDPPADPSDSLTILQALDDVDSGASYGSNAVGSAELRVMDGNNSVQASNYGSNSFEIENTGDKQIAAVFIDFRNALYGDSIVDFDGSSGDNTAKKFDVNNGEGATGAFFESNDAETYFLPGEDPLPNTTGTGVSSSGGWRGLLLKFDGTGFDDGEVVSFAGDMDPNSLAGLDKSGGNGVDSGAINSWDVGGVSGAELIGSAFTVRFDDGSFATGHLGSDGSQAGSVGTAVQNRPDQEVTVTVNGFSSDEAGTYGGTEPEIVVTGTPGATVLVTLSRGVNPVTNTSNGVAQLVENRLDDAHSEFPVSNAADFQTVEVTIGGDGTATVPNGAFDYGSPAQGGQSFSGSAFTPGFATAPMAVAASAVGNDGTPLGPVNRVYLTNPTNTPVESSGDGGTPGTGAEGYYELIGAGGSARYKVQIEDANANGGTAPGGKWNFVDSADGDGHQSGFQGDGYYLFGSDNSTAINGVNQDEVLNYTIYVPEGETGTYDFRFRVSRDGDEASDQQNDLLLNFKAADSNETFSAHAVLDGNDLHQGSQGFAKIFGGPNNGSWGFSNKVDGEPGDPNAQVQIDEPGLYTVQIAGRSQGYHLDFWELYKGSAPGTSASDSAFIAGEPDDDGGDTGDGSEPGIIRKAIVSGSDDTDQDSNGGSVNLAKADLELGDSGRDIGLRFTDLDLASLDGADITDAYIEFTNRSSGGSSGTINATIALEDSLSPATFSASNTPFDRDQFDFTTDWTDSDVPAANETFRTADFSDMLETFVTSWADDLGSTDDLVFVLEDENGVRKAESFEGGDAPELVIEYDYT